jgi:hypothetical protein
MCVDVDGNTLLATDVKCNGFHAIALTHPYRCTTVADGILTRPQGVVCLDGVLSIADCERIVKMEVPLLS